MLLIVFCVCTCSVALVLHNRRPKPELPKQHEQTRMPGSSNVEMNSKWFYVMGISPISVAKSPYVITPQQKIMKSQQERNVSYD